MEHKTRMGTRTVVLWEFFVADTERSIKLNIDNCLRPYMTQIGNIWLGVIRTGNTRHQVKCWRALERDEEMISVFFHADIPCISLSNTKGHSQCRTPFLVSWSECSEGRLTSFFGNVNLNGGYRHVLSRLDGEITNDHDCLMKYR